MRRALLIAAAVSAAAPFAAAAGEAERHRIAVLDVRAVQGVAPGTATILTNIVVDDTARGGWDVISQADVAALLGFERQRRMLGCGEDSSCLAEIGGALGVEFVLTGQVGQIGTRYHLSFQILDARKAKVVARSARFSERTEDDLANAAQRCVADLLAAARARGAAPAGARAGAAAAVPLPPPPDLSARPAPPPGSTSPAPSARPSRTAAWVALGAGVLLAAGGAAFGLKARSERASLEGSLADPNYPAIYETKSRAVADARLLSNVCWGAAAVSAAASGWLFWRGRAPAVAVAPSVAEGGGVALVAGGAF